MNTSAAIDDAPAVGRPVVGLNGVSVAFGGLLALSDVSLDVAMGERLAILGPNGAGKTTLFNVIAGDVSPTRGVVSLKGVDCTYLPPRVRPRLGVARTYQRTRLFDALSVEDNLYIAQTGKVGRHFSLLRNRRDEELRERARRAADDVWLRGHLDTIVADLSHGQRRQVEIGMALVTEPDVMMLDEPASGLSRGERERLVELLDVLPTSTTLLLIEHDMDVALKVAHRVVVMADGELVAEGTPDEIRHNSMVHAIYLGREGDA